MTTTGRGLEVAGPKLILTPDGRRCYAYSGSIGVVQSNTTLLLFESRFDPIDMLFRFNTQTTDDDIRFTILFNDVVVQGYTIGSSNNHSFQQGIKLIVPQSTTVTCLGYNESSSTSRTCYASATGLMV